MGRAGTGECGSEFSSAVENTGHGDRVGFLARIAAESAAKRDLPDAISIAGSLREDLNAALDVLLRRAQQAEAVRADVRTPDLIVLLKGLLASLADISDPARRDLVFAVLADGLRPSR